MTRNLELPRLKASIVLSGTTHILVLESIKQALPPYKTRLPIPLLATLATYPY